ncbi:hypothetical protein BDN72DRAFT_828546 [Pluteus cervinus]|uniref:Uncharacterized protein n=1 Tax=Pluteus cervinus TaxID=181527 RepID=A0ACD3A6M5_9AGAR|nr:hypothetical protein BDN72DRAFT_828546 [Pluteus cervinus]
MQPDIPADQQHHRFFFAEEFITLKVDTIYFKLPTFILKKHSKKLQQVIDQAQGVGLDSSFALLLKGISAVDLERFLGLLFPTEYGQYDATSFDEWASILKVSHLWEFKAIFKLALQKIKPLSASVDKVVLGKAYNIPEWATEGRVQLCRRDEPITLEEAIRMGMEEVVNISKTRHHIRPSEMSPETQDSTIRSLLSGERPRKTGAHEIPTRPNALQDPTVPTTTTSFNMFCNQNQKNETVSRALDFRKQRHVLKNQLAVLNEQKAEHLATSDGNVLTEEIEELVLQIDRVEDGYVDLYKGRGKYKGWSGSHSLTIDKFDNVRGSVESKLTTCLHPDAPTRSLKITFSPSCKKKRQGTTNSPTMEQETLDLLKRYDLDFGIDETGIITVQVP